MAAVVVAAARHVDGALTPDVAVNELKNNAGIRDLVRDSIVERAPERMIAGGRAALSKLIDDIFIKKGYNLLVRPVDYGSGLTNVR